MKRRHIPVSDILSIKNTEMGTRCILYLGDSEDDNSAVRKVSVYVGIKFRQETYPAARLLIFNRNQQSNLSS